MKIRIKKFGIEIWNDVSLTPKVRGKGTVELHESINWKVTTIYFNPIEQLKQFIWIQIDEAFRRYFPKEEKIMLIGRRRRGF